MSAHAEQHEASRVERNRARAFSVTRGARVKLGVAGRR